MKKELGIFILLVLLCGVASLKSESNFLSVYNLQNAGRQIGEFGILSIGLGIVIITGGIDLSVGSILALQGVSLALLLNDRQYPWPLAVGLILGGALLLGILHGLAVTKIKMQPFIVTLCGLLIYRSLARTLAGDQSQGFGDSEYGMLRWLATGKLYGVPMPFITMLVVAVIGWVVLHRSVYGRYLLAVGRNEEAARYSGIKSDLVIISAYAICTFLAAFSGIIFALDTNSIQGVDFGSSYELYGIAGAVLGGCSLRGGEGSIIGIVIGTALLQVLQNVVNLFGVPSSHNYAVMGVVIFVGVLVDQVMANRRASRVQMIVPAPAARP